MEPFIAQIVMFGGNFAPRAWAKCDGQLLAINSNSALFSILGTTYGGDGRTTFALPDMRGRVAIHPGQGAGLSNYNQGPGGGHENVTLTKSNLPAHNHGMTYSIGDPKGTPNYISVGNPPHLGDQDLETNTAMIGSTGNSQPFSIVQPYCVVQFIIALQGTYPSRS